MHLRNLSVAFATLVIAACGKKEAPKSPQEPAKVATTEPDKEPTKEPDKQAEAPDKQAEPVAKAPEKPAEPAKVMAPADLKTKYDAIMTAAWQGSDSIAVEYADDANIGLTDAPETQTKGGAGAVEFYKHVLAQFPDFKRVPQLVLVGDQRVLAVMLVTATQTGEMGSGRKPTGKKIGLLGAQYVTWNADGKITGDWHFVNQTIVAGQLGLLPPEVPFRAIVDKGVDAPVVVLASGSDAEKAMVKHHQAEQVAFNTKDMKWMEADDANVAADIVFHNMMAPTDSNGKEAYNQGFAAFLAANPDLKADGEDIWAAGDYCVHQSTIGGTNTGEWVEGDKKMPASNKPWKVMALEIERFSGGKLAEFSLFANGLAMAQQLGWVPQGGAAEKPAEPGAAPKTP